MFYWDAYGKDKENEGNRRMCREELQVDTLPFAREETEPVSVENIPGQVI